MAVADPHVVPHFDRAALVVIDAQVDFAEGGRSPIDGTTAIVPRLATLVAAFRAAGRPIVHIVRLYDRDGDDVDLVRRTLVASGMGPVAPGTPGSQLLDPLRPAGAPHLDHERLVRGEAQHLGPDEAVLWKPRWSAFFRTALDRHLRTRDVDTIVIAGCNFPNCPRATAFDASELDYRTVLAADALSGATADHVVEMQRIGVLAASTDELCRKVRQAAA